MGEQEELTRDGVPIHLVGDDPELTACGKRLAREAWRTRRLAETTCGECKHGRVEVSLAVTPQDSTLKVGDPVHIDDALPPPPVKRRRGFAAMDPAKVREISHKGGKSAHIQGKAHVFTSEEARAAGRKGGLATHAKRSGG